MSLPESSNALYRGNSRRDSGYIRYFIAALRM
jgi:hypothetical protein